jgi:hypothetical protein
MDKYTRYRAKDVDAYRAKKAEWARTPEQREKRTAYMKLWRERNRAKHNEQAKASHHRNKHKHVGKATVRYLHTKYGMTVEDRDVMIRSQNGSCRICGKTLRPKLTHIDHCHKTGAVRGILCHYCNTKLGWYELHEKEVKAYLGA